MNKRYLMISRYIPFETKTTEMSQTFYAQMAESAKLDAVILENLELLGYGK